MDKKTSSDCKVVEWLTQPHISRHECMCKYIDIHVQVSSHRYLSQWIVLHIKQGVITLVRPVEPFTAGIKQMKSRINMSIDTKSSNQGMFQIDNQVATRVKWNKPDIYQVIKDLSRVRSHDQGKFLSIKNLDSGHTDSTNFMRVTAPHEPNASDTPVNPCIIFSLCA